MKFTFVNYRNSYCYIWSNFLIEEILVYPIIILRYSPQLLILFSRVFEHRLISIFNLYFFTFHSASMVRGNQTKQIRSGNVITDSIFQYMGEQIRRRREVASSLCQKSCHRCILHKVVNHLCKAVCGLFSVTMNFTRINKSRNQRTIDDAVPRIRSSIIYKLLSIDRKFDEMELKRLGLFVI